MSIKNVIQKDGSPIKLWAPIEEVESQALDQLIMTSQLPFIFRHIAVMPDVHFGNGCCVGTVLPTQDCIIVSTVGSDLGCGMRGVKTPFKGEDVMKRLADIRHSIERSIPVGRNMNKKIDPEIENFAQDMEYSFQENICQETYEEFRLEDIWDRAQLQLGSLGGGNHFVELCLDQEDSVWITLHSGSRNIGKRIGDYFGEKAKEICHQMHIKLPHPDLAYLAIESPYGQEFIHLADWAQKYAYENRQEMMRRALKDLSYIVTGKFDCERLFDVDCHHNYISLENHFGKNVYVTRKGAIRAREGDFGLIPGSMNTSSFIVRGKGNPDSFCSASHGAGRVMSRTEAKKTFTAEDVKKQLEGNECRKNDSIIDELPLCYKDIMSVMENQNDLVEIMYKLKQIITIKG